MIRIGVAGWDYTDWGGVVYPAPRPRRFDPIRFLSGYFDLIEINVSFYRQPDPVQARSWTGRAVAAGACFSAKLYRGLTHAGTQAAPQAGPDARPIEEMAARYREGIEPLREAGILRAVLMQFPQSFHDREMSRSRLARLCEHLEGLPLVAEFRHESWGGEAALGFLRGLKIGFCNIDQPALSATLPPTAHVTSPLAYVRLHGRNAANWFRDGVPAAARYDYFYSSAELEPWVERVRSLARRAEEVLIIANNHYRGKGPANALMLKAALTGGRVRAPASLAAAYPGLGAVAVPDPSGPAQSRLF